MSGVLMVYVSTAHAGLWRHSRKADKPAETASMVASVALTTIQVDGSRVILWTNGAPAYTSYKSAPGVFVVDLSATNRDRALTIPNSLPPAVASIAADDLVEMGSRLTRVTFRLTEPLDPEVSAIEKAVIVTFPATKTPLEGSQTEVLPQVVPLASGPKPVTSEPAPEPAADEQIADGGEAPAVPVQPVDQVAENPVQQTPAQAPASVPTIAAAAPAVDAMPLPPARILMGVEAENVDGRVEVRISADGRLDYKTFRLDGPPRLVIDLAGVKNVSPQKNVEVENGLGLVSRVRIGQFQPDVARVVVDLAQECEYQVSAVGDQVRVLLGSHAALASKGAQTPDPERTPADTKTPAGVMTDANKSTPAAPPPQSPPMVKATPEERTATTAEKPEITAEKPAVTAEKPAVTAEKPAVTAEKPAVHVEKPAENPAVVVEEPATQTPQPLPAATTDIPAQVPAIAPDAPDWKMPAPASKGARSVITAPADQAPVQRPATQEDVFGAAAQAPSPTAPRSLDEPSTSRTLSGQAKVFNGEPISLNLKDSPIKDVLRTFAELTGLNIAIDPGVQGSVTVDFVDVPWDQALDLILRQNNLTYTLEGNVMRVGYLERIAAEKVATRRLEEEERLNVPLMTLSYKLSYARAAEVKTLLQDLASPRARIIVDTRTNQLIISEIPEYLRTMQNLIATVDIPTPQVAIEARIVESSRTFSRQWGFDWNFSGDLDPALGTGTGLIFPNRIGYTGGPFTFGLGDPIFSLQLFDVLGTFNLDLALSAAEAQGYLKVVSAPRVTTQDNHAAEIQSGFQIPYQTRVNLTTTITYLDATLRLQVTPQITQSGTVIMDIQVQKNEPATGLAIPGAAGTPLTTRQARTRLMVRDGGTAVIAGIFQTRDNDAKSRVPFIHNIPVIGALFRSTDISTSHDELLIFITPRIVRG